eukprot:jgi/Ulvmu1/11648/UM008_0052.1
MPSNGHYSVNPLLNRWEEERFQRMMAHRVNNATSSVNTGKSSLRSRCGKTPVQPKDMIAKEIGQLEELLQSGQQTEADNHEQRKEIQKRLQRVKQIACLAKSSKVRSKCATMSPRHPSLEDCSPALPYATSLSSCASTKTTIPSCRAPHKIPHITRNEQVLIPGHHPLSSGQEAIAFCHPPPEPHLLVRHVRHSKAQPRGKSKPSWDTSFAAENEDGYVPNVRNRKLLLDPATSKFRQHEQIRDMHALSATATSSRARSGLSGSTTQRTQPSEITAGSHAALQRVLLRREQRAQRRRSAKLVAAPKTTVQALVSPQRPLPRRRAARSTAPVQVASVTSAIHPAAGAGPAARKRFGSVPSPAAGGAMQCGKQLARTTAKPTGAGMGTGHSDYGRDASLDGDAIEAGMFAKEGGSVDEEMGCPSGHARPQTPRLKPSDKPKLQNLGQPGEQATQAEIQTDGSHLCERPVRAVDAATRVRAPVGSAPRTRDGDAASETLKPHRAAIEADTPVCGSADEDEDVSASGARRGQLAAEEEGRDEMFERAKARVGFRGLPAAFMLDRLAEAGGATLAATSARGSDTADDGRCSDPRTVPAAPGGGSGTQCGGSAHANDGVRGQGRPGSGASTVVKSEHGDVEVQGVTKADRDHHAAPRSSVRGSGKSSSYGSSSGAASRARSGDLNDSFRHAMLRRMAGGDSQPSRELATSSGHTYKGTARSSEAGGRSGAAWGHEEKHRAQHSASIPEDGAIGASHRGSAAPAPSADAAVPCLGTCGDSATAERVCDILPCDAPDIAGETPGRDACAVGAADPETPTEDAADEGCEFGRGAQGSARPSVAVQPGLAAALRRESREEGRVLHTFVADSQESLKSLRTLLNRSREGLHAGARDSRLLQHARVSDHGDMVSDHGDTLAEPPRHAAAAATAVPRGPPSRWGAAADAPLGAPMLWEGDGVAESAESSPALSLVAAPGRELHTSRVDMFILQRQESRYDTFGSPMGPAHMHSGTAESHDADNGRGSPSDRYSSAHDSSSHGCASDPQPSVSPVPADHGSMSPRGALWDAGHSMPARAATASRDDGPCTGSAVPLQLQHAKAVMGDIALRYGLDATGSMPASALSSGEWHKGEPHARAASASLAAAAIADCRDGQQDHAACGQLDEKGGVLRRKGSSPHGSSGVGGPVHSGHVDGVDPDADTAAQLYGPDLAGTPNTGGLIGEGSMVLQGSGGPGGCGGNPDGARVGAEVGVWVVSGERYMDEYNDAEEYGDVGTLADDTVLHEVDGGVLYEASGMEFGDVIAGAGGMAGGFVAVTEPGMPFVWTDAASGNLEMYGAGDAQARGSKTAQDCTQIELIEDGEDV